MVFTLELILTLFFAHKVWKEKDRARLILWFMTAMICLMPGFKVVKGTPPVNWLFPTLYFMRLLKDKEFLASWKFFPLKYIYLVILLFHFVQPLFVKFTTYGSTYFNIIQYVMTSLFYIFIGYSMRSDYKKVLTHRNWIYLLIVLLFGIGVISKFLNYNILTNQLYTDTIWGADNAFSDRGFRVTGTQSSPNIFGFINVFLVICLLFIHDVKRTRLFFGILCFVNIINSGTRAPFVGLLLVLMLYFVFGHVRVLFRSLIPMTFAFFLCSPVLMKYQTSSSMIMGVADIFMTGGENTTGSSTELRERQMAVATYFADSHPYIGSGNGFCNSIQNEDSSLHIYYDSDLAGAEGYIFYVLIDYGYVYFVLVIFFGVSLLFILFTGLFKDKELASFGLLLLFALVSHLITSRPNNSWQIFLPFLGMVLWNLQKTCRSVSSLSRPVTSRRLLPR